MRGNSTKVTVTECWLKKVGRIGNDRISAVTRFRITEPITEAFLHMRAFYKYQAYQPYKKFPVDIWEDLCGWLNGTKNSFYLNWTLEPAKKFITYDGEMKCPLIGNLDMKFENISLNSRFPLTQIVPSGRYRVEVNFTEGDRSTIISGKRYYFSISDNRIGQF